MDLTVEERLLLLAVQRHPLGVSRACLLRLTGLTADTTHCSLLSLESRGLVRREIAQDQTHYLPDPVTDGPMFPGWEAWLDNFWAVCSPAIRWDTMDATSCSCGAVMITALVSGSADECLIVEATKLPGQFVKLVMLLMATQKVWWTESFHEFRQFLSRRPGDFREVECHLGDAVEEFWDFCWTPGIEDALHRLREDHQVRAESDRWIDGEGDCVPVKYIM